MLCIIVLLHFWIVNDRHFLGPKEQELLAEAAEANASYFDIFFGLSIHLPLFCHRSQISRCFGFDMNVTSPRHTDNDNGCVTPEAPKPRVSALPGRTQAKGGRSRNGAAATGQSAKSQIFWVSTLNAQSNGKR